MSPEGQANNTHFPLLHVANELPLHALLLLEEQDPPAVICPPFLGEDFAFGLAVLVGLRLLTEDVCCLVRRERAFFVLVVME